MSAILRCFTAGSVDDGKSTLLGRLLYETGTVPDDVLQSLRAGGQGEIDFSLVTDGLQAEREQRITIDVAYRYLRRPGRVVIFADAPGHEQYTRNAATAASTADVALLLLDVTKGLLPQTHRHASIAWLFGVRHFVVAINKMDLVDFQEVPFRKVERSLQEFFSHLGPCQLHCIPTAARSGENVTKRSAQMPWYCGRSVLDILEILNLKPTANGPARFVVQAVLRSPDGERRYAGRVLSGAVRPGDTLRVLPGVDRARVDAVFCGVEAMAEALPGRSVAMKLSGEHDIARGMVLTQPSDPPARSTRLSTTVIWLGEHPAALGRNCILKHPTGEYKARIDAIHGRLDPATLNSVPADSIACNDIAEVGLALDLELCFDPYRAGRALGSAILIDSQTSETIAAVLISGSPAREDTNIRPEPTKAPSGLVVWLTGLSSAGKSTLAGVVSGRLRALGREVEWLDGDAMRAHLGRDLGFSRADRDENIARISFVASLLAQHGVTVVVSAISPYRSARENARRQAPTFLEVYVNAPLVVCQQRDVKGLYQRARAGSLQHLTGVDDPYEPPLAPAVECRTDLETVQESAAKVLAAIAAAR